MFYKTCIANFDAIKRVLLGRMIYLANLNTQSFYHVNGRKYNKQDVILRKCIQFRHYAT